MAYTMQGRKFYLYDTINDVILGEVSFEIPNVNYTYSEIGTSLRNIIGGADGASISMDVVKYLNISNLMNLSQMTALCPTNFIQSGVSYPLSDTQIFSEVIAPLKGVSYMGDINYVQYPTIQYYLLIDNAVKDNNYFELAIDSQLGLYIRSFKYNGSVYNFSTNNFAGVGIGSVSGETRLGASCITSDNALYYCKCWCLNSGTRNCYYRVVASGNLFKNFVDLYNSAGLVSTFNVTYDLDGCTGAETNPETIVESAVITRFSFTPSGNVPFNSSSVWIEGKGLNDEPVQFTWDADTGELRVGVVTSDIIIHVYASSDPYTEIDGLAEITGGSSISIPSLPPLSATNSGAVGLFAPSTSQMRLLSDYMWTDFGGTGSTEVDVLKEVVQAIKRVVANPLEYIFGLNIIPSQGLSIGSSEEIRFGFVNSGISMPRLTSQYFSVDCGSIYFNTVCGDTFLDYAPYSKFSIYLPYIGVKDVDANDFVNHTIGVIYHGDVVTGGVTAYITKDGSVMYQYSGCCALTIPMSADSWGNTISGAVQISTALISSMASGGSAGMAEAAVSGASSVASNPSLLSPSVARSGAISGGAGCMGVQVPFVIREAVRFHSTAGFNSVAGYPSYYFSSLSSMSGYTTVYETHLEGISATSKELNEIESLLKTGVIL